MIARAAALLARLVRHRSGVAMTEFALGLPLLLTAGLWGTETANFAVTSMRVSQLAMHIADNGSRVGDTSTLENRRIYESDLNDLLLGANMQAGQTLDFFDHGRVIVSSLEYDEVLGRDFIHWQRCKGVMPQASSYGEEGDRLPAGTGMGPPGNQVNALEGEAVIFVELAYEYQPLISDSFMTSARTIRAIASFTVRDDRDLSQIYQRDPASPDPVAACTKFDSYA